MLRACIWNGIVCYRSKPFNKTPVQKGCWLQEFLPMQKHLRTSGALPLSRTLFLRKHLGPRASACKATVAGPPANPDALPAAAIPKVAPDDRGTGVPPTRGIATARREGGPLAMAAATARRFGLSPVPPMPENGPIRKSGDSTVRRSEGPEVQRSLERVGRCGVHETVSLSRRIGHA